MHNNLCCEDLQALLGFWLPAAFKLGHMVSEAGWESRAEGSGKGVFAMLGQCLMLLIHLFGPAVAVKENYVRTLSCALVTWQSWMESVPGVCHAEEATEALLSRFGHRLEVHSHLHEFDDT